MSDVRVLFDPNRIRLPPGHGAPRAVGRVGTEERLRLGEFLDAVLHVPLGSSESQRHERVETALDTMTRPERIYLEIEMQSRLRALHSFDYDALR